MKPHSLKLFIQESNINFHTWFITAAGFRHRYFERYCGGVVGTWACHVENDVGGFYLDPAAWLALGRGLERSLDSGRLQPRWVEREHLKNGRGLFTIAAQIERASLERASLAQIRTWLRRIWKLHDDLTGAGFLLVASDFDHSLLMSRAHGVLAKRNLPNAALQQNLSLLTSPHWETLYRTEQGELLALAARHKTEASLEGSKAFSAHVARWHWLNYGYQGPSWSAADFAARAEGFRKRGSLKEQLAEHRSELKNVERRQAALAKKLKLTAEERSLMDTVALFTHLKGYRIEARHRTCSALDALFTELAVRFAVPLTFFRYATPEEIEKLMAKKRVDVLGAVARRRNMLQLLDRGRYALVPAAAIAKTLARLTAVERLAKTDTVTGQVAYPGKAKGIVRILKSPADVFKVKHGDVLVTFATTPDFLPAMYRAVAFVTDQGGITSHAAIVSRELKKPCVIGTKVGSKVFSDGDVVEVDATEGTVRKVAG